MLNWEPPDAQIARRSALDSNDEATAQRSFITGLRTAHSSGDGVIGTNIRTLHEQATCDHDPRDEVRLAESAWTGAKDLTPAMEASIQGSLADAAARACQPLLPRGRGRMFQLTAAWTRRRATYIYWWSEAEAHWAAGPSALFLGDLRQAEAHYRDALAHSAPSFSLGCDGHTWPPPRRP